ncbi:MAG: hypothetical protein IIB41_03725 [Candidatus Marinimicrobia bacterium]|nr:hypothetical protein [Candidatus Neomarinimicrobiota bacterium]
MNPITNAILGISFLGLGIAGTVLMYWLWGFPYDHEKFKTGAPPHLIFIHRSIGYLYLIVYLLLMWQMVPRLWSYQIEFPARTVVHLSLGILIGGILFLKVLVVRFFKHLESRLAPMFGTLLMLSTLLLVGLSVPMAFKEYQLRRNVAGGDVFSEENILRIKRIVPEARFGSEVPLDEITTKESLMKGRKVLLNKCVQCHDLRTVLLKPRTPSNWVNLVIRMSERTVALPIYEEEQWWVSAYLIALSPELQKGVMAKKEMEKILPIEKIEMVSDAVIELPKGSTRRKYDLIEVKSLFEVKCSACHYLSNIENNPPETGEEVQSLLSRMIGNGLDISDSELDQIAFYLSETYTR